MREEIDFLKAEINELSVKNEELKVELEQVEKEKQKLVNILIEVIQEIFGLQI